ncbi:MAG: HlyD family type I secretion periplasmic adaptor subunit [Rhodospirillales bacterium CG15_BIG_FIL_POST_REV_8_21_14_020_66_15]|nr:MAG: HlyD family type I secretion periplasmic adaptor subunit [Rhodospirillales bacterium CG15_BIG_FIL_POST_REV_8_21_14_020_66_15]
MYAKLHALLTSARRRAEFLARRITGHLPRRRAPRDARPLDRQITRLHRLGWALILVFLVGGGLWAATARLEGAAIALGTVGVESNRKSVAHLEGGIVRDILVSEGDHVVRGQPLVRLDDTMARATLDLLSARRDGLLAKRARLIAERGDETAIAFPAELLDRARDASVAELMAGETRVLTSRRENLERQDAVLTERLAKHEQEITGLKAKLAAAKESLVLLREEREMMESLFKKGLMTKDRLLAIKRRAVQAKGEIGDIQARIARAGEAKGEIEMQRVLNRDTQAKQVVQDLQDTQERLAEVREKVRAARDILARTDIRAPASGLVVGLKVHTTGGIIKPGQPVLDLVPDADRTVVELRIDPKDVGAVYPGMAARVRLTAFNARTTPMLAGRVTRVSADRMIDPQTGAAYFSGRVVPDAPGLPQLRPGMQAEVFLVTTERTVLDYLLDPLVRAVDRAGREL